MSTKKERKNTSMCTSKLKISAVLFFGMVLLGGNELYAVQDKISPGITVEKAVAEALSHNKELAVVQEEVGLAKAEWIKAKTLPFNPEIEGERSRGGESFSSTEEKETSFGISQELEIFGQRWVRKSAAKYRWEAAKARLEKFRRDLAADVAQVFQNLLFLEKQVEVLRTVSEFDQQIRDSAEARLKGEFISQLSFDLMQLEYDNSRAEFTNGEAELASGRLSFNRLLGRPPDRETMLKGNLSYTPLDLSPESLESLAFQHQQDWFQAELETKAAQKDVSLARREALPNPKLELAFSDAQGVIDGKDISGTPSIVDGIDKIEDRDKSMTLKLSLPLPIFNRNQGGVAEAKAARSVAERSQEELRLRIRTEVRQVYHQLDAAEKIVKIYQEIEPRLDRDLDLVRKAYVRGQIPVEDYLVQKDHFIQGKLSYLTAFERYFSARAEMEKAVGLPWDRLMEYSKGEKP